MKIHHLLILPLVPLISGAAMGATVGLFDGGADTPFNFSNFSDPNVANGGPSIQATGGNPGGFMQLTNNVNGQNNWAMFDRSDVGTYPISTFSVDFRIDNLGAGGADGFSLSYFNTANHGTSGAIGSSIFTPEDPAAVGVLGFGFDTWGNAGPIDAVPATGEYASNYSEISLFFNGSLVQRVDDTRLLATPFDIKDGAWHTASGVVDFAGGTASLTVDGVSIFNDVQVPGLTPFESRIGFAGRTGGANERLSLDNLGVQFIPEPGVIGLIALGGLAFVRRRR